MQRFIFIRDFKIVREGLSTIIILKGCCLHIEPESWALLNMNGENVTDELTEVDISLVNLLEEMRIYLLEIDADLFKTSFQSFAYTNWLKEKVADIDERGDPLYPNLSKTPETLIMYLMELGIPADTLMRYMYGQENKYLEYKYLVQEFGKMI